MNAHKRVAATARRQYGLITAEQLRRLGVSADTTTCWARAGHLHRVHRGVYAVGHRALSREAHVLAAVLAIGPDAAVSHWSAARLWGLLPDRGDLRRDPVDVIVRRRLVRRKGIRAHFTSALHRADTMWWDRIPVTTPYRTLLDLASVLPEDRLRRAVRQAEVDRLVRQSGLEDQLARAPPHSPATRRLARVIAPGPTPTRSELEDAMLELLARHGFPRPQVNVPLQLPGRRVEVDFLFPQMQLVLETDGYRFHGTRLAAEADAARQADLETAGYRVVRLNYRQVIDDEQRTVARLRRIVDQQTAR